MVATPFRLKLFGRNPTLFNLERFRAEASIAGAPDLGQSTEGTRQDHDEHGVELGDASSSSCSTTPPTSSSSFSETSQLLFDCESYSDFGDSATTSSSSGRVLDFKLTRAKQGASPVDLAAITPTPTTSTTFLIPREPLMTPALTRPPLAALISSCRCVTMMSQYLLSYMRTPTMVKISPLLLTKTWERLYQNATRLRNYACLAGLSTAYSTLYLAPPANVSSRSHCCRYYDSCWKYQRLSHVQRLAAVFYLAVLDSDLTGTTPLTLDSWVSRYPTARQRELRLAFERLHGSMHVQTAQTKVRNFIKVEPMAKCSDPRNISPRNDSTLVTLGPYFSAVEHRAVSLPFLIKGCDIPSRAERMRDLLGWPHYYEIDYSRFDLSISVELLSQFEHSG